MNVVTEMVEGVEIVKVEGPWVDVLKYVDEHRIPVGDMNVLFVGNYSSGGKAFLTREFMTCETSYRDQTHYYMIRGKLPVVRTKIAMIQRGFPPQGYGGYSTPPKNRPDLGEGIVEVVYQHSNSCD